MTDPRPGYGPFWSPITYVPPVPETRSRRLGRAIRWLTASARLGPRLLPSHGSLVHRFIRELRRKEFDA